MSYGFEVFDDSGVVILDSNTIAFLPLDVIPVLGGESGSTTYNLSNIKGVVVPTSPIEMADLTTSRLIVTVSGSVLSWSWQVGTTDWLYDSANILVFHGG